MVDDVWSYAVPSGHSCSTICLLTQRKYLVQEQGSKSLLFGAQLALLKVLHDSEKEEITNL